MLPACFAATTLHGTGRAEDTEAAPTLDACIEAHEQAQIHRKNGALLLARERLMTCSRDACPDIARVDCGRWLGEIRQEIPSVVLGARNPDGTDAVDVSVRLDGSPLTNRLDGAAVEMDPGVHVLRLEAAGALPKEQRFVLRVGERNRSIMVALEALPKSAPAPVPEASSLSPAAYVLAGVGVLGLAGFGYFGLTGLSKESDLEACKPNCATDDVDAVRTRYLAADISLAVGLVGLGGASYLYFTRSGDPPNADGGATVAVRVVGGSQGAGAAVTGTF